MTKQAPQLFLGILIPGITPRSETIFQGPKPSIPSHRKILPSPHQLKANLLKPLSPRAQVAKRGPRPRVAQARFASSKSRARCTRITSLSLSRSCTASVAARKRQQPAARRRKCQALYNVEQAAGSNLTRARPALSSASSHVLWYMER